MITEKVGIRIRELRNELNLSQEKLALKADVDRTYLAGVEQGKRNPSIKSLEKTCPFTLFLGALFINSSFNNVKN